MVRAPNQFGDKYETGTGECTVLVSDAKVFLRVDCSTWSQLITDEAAQATECLRKHPQNSGGPGTVPLPGR